VGEDFSNEDDVIIGFRDEIQHSAFEALSFPKTFSISGFYFNYDHPLARNDEFRQAMTAFIPSTSSTDQRLLQIFPAEWSGDLALELPPRRMDASKLVADALEKIGMNEIDIAVPASTLRAEWCQGISRRMMDERIPISFVPMEKMAESPVFLAGFIPSVPGLRNIVDLFKPRSAWVNFAEDDEVFARLTRSALTTLSLKDLSRFNQHLFEKAYALPFLHQPLRYYVNRGSKGRVAFEVGGIDFRLDDIRPVGVE
jgi:hypothetical protein